MLPTVITFLSVSCCQQILQGKNIQRMKIITPGRQTPIQLRPMLYMGTLRCPFKEAFKFLARDIKKFSLLSLLLSPPIILNKKHLSTAYKATVAYTELKLLKAIFRHYCVWLLSAELGSWVHLYKSSLYNQSESDGIAWTYVNQNAVNNFIHI